MGETVLSNPYPSISEDDEVHNLVLKHEDYESHDDLFPDCDCLKSEPDEDYVEVSSFMKSYAKGIVRQLKENR